MKKQIFKVGTVLEHVKNGRQLVIVYKKGNALKVKPNHLVNEQRSSDANVLTIEEWVRKGIWKIVTN